jgi:putative ABC transport system permease protein
MSVEALKDDYRDQQKLRLIEVCALEIRYVVRGIRNQPGFTAIAVLTLALGIGVTTAMFSVVYGVLWRPLPYANAARLVKVSAERVVSGRATPVETTFALADVREWQSRSRTLQSVTMFGSSTNVLAGEYGAEPVNVATVSDAFFTTLGGRMALGRALGTMDDQSPSVVISERLWRQRFAGSQSAIGTTLTIDNAAYTIVGVVDSAFAIPGTETDIWRTSGFAQTLQPGLAFSGGFSLVARVAETSTVEDTRAESGEILSALAKSNPRQYSEARVIVVGLLEQVVAKARPVLLMLFGAAGLMLLVSCANFGNLLVTKQVSRAREIAIQFALGASPSRVVLQSIIGANVLAAIGAAIGAGIAWIAVASLKHLQPSGLPRLDAVRIDGPVLAFTALLSLVAGIAVGLLPIVQFSGISRGLVREHGAAQGRRMGGVLVVAQLAVTVVLLIGALLFGRSLVRLLGTDLGVSTDGVTVALVNSSADTRTSSFAYRRTVIGEMMQRVRALPGVASVGAGAGMPPDRARLRMSMRRVDEAVGQPTNFYVDAVAATPGFFSTLGVRLQKGRIFTEADHSGSPQVAILGAVTARQLFGSADPIGRTITLPMLTDPANPGPTSALMTVVGVVDDVKYSGLAKNADGVIYRPFAQQPLSTMFIVARSNRMLTDLPSNMRRAISSVDRSAVIYTIDTLDELVSQAAAEPRFRTAVLVSVSGLALVLTTLGLYGVLAFTVAKRTAEIGVRVALGASRDDIQRMVLREGAALAFIGVGIGLLLALAIARSVAYLLYGVQPADPMTFVVTATIVFLTSLVAAYIPARRAARVDPLVALRYE